MAGAEEIVTAYPMRGFVGREKWRDIISGARRQLWLYGIAESGYADDPKVFEIIVTAAREKCEVRVLLLDPEATEIVTALDREENNPVGTLDARIRAALIQFDRMRSECRERMSIRLYRTKPQVSIVLGDDEALITHYVRFLSGNNSPTFEVHRMRSDGIFERYVTHFQNVWEDAQPWPA